MPITKSKTPNEFLVRWSDSGVIQGAHIVFREAITEDGTELSSKMLPAQPVSMAGEAGFPLADVLDILQSDALGTIEAKDAEIATIKADAEKAKTDAAQALSAMTAERDAAIAQAAPLQAQIDAAAPPAVNGVPQSITKKQGRAQLKAEGLLAAVESYIASLPADDDTRMVYEDAGTWVRTDPSVLGMMTLLQKTDADADAFFVAAAQR